MQHHFTGKHFAFLMFIFCAFTSLNAQNSPPLFTQYLQTYAETAELTPSDYAGLVITDQYDSRHNGVTHVHVRQSWQGIEVYNGTANFTIRNGEVLHMADRLQANLATRAQSTQPSILPAQAIQSAVQALELTAMAQPVLIEKLGTNEFLFTESGVSQERIPVKLMYLPGPEDELFLVWDLSIYTLDAEHWWSVRVDAQTGTLLDQVDWVTHCSFPNHDHRSHTSLETHSISESASILGAQGACDPQYRVLPFTIESPNHGVDVLVVNPSDSIASPFGWHDINGVPGYEYTITRGNNVYASEDRDADNAPGYSPDGDTCLNFDFPHLLNQTAANYEDASITNLFYMNNIMHDIWYRYGFDEASGNFQENNYGRGGVGSDYVNADAQDGGGTNNANFGTPPEGSNPRMQMFLWTGSNGTTNVLRVNSPSPIAGFSVGSEATFGPGLPNTPLTADLVLVNDGTNPDPEDACDPLLNGPALAGKIALIDRGSCSFVFKVEAAQNAGAIGVVIINNQAGGTIPLGGTSNTITIPSVMIPLADGVAIKNRIAAGDIVNGTLQNFGGNFDRDGDFDNGIIAHEYGHGISIRLTGGASSSGCLSNDEQMGEGWSDWFGLMLHLDTSNVNRGIGTFASSQPTNGVGIRPARYSPDFSVNNFTYGATNNTGQISQPHGIGFVWCTMLWDLALELIDVYGYDPDLYNGTGGNNIAMQLVIDGIKLQPCSPGFIDGRDAILLADQVNNGGANECLIWEVFARRGLGLSASQGSSQSRSDQVEAFDIPPTCTVPTAPPTAAFASIAAACNDRYTFQDQSSDTPQLWSWDFGDGNTSTDRNPVHTYSASGNYIVRLIIQNTLGADTFSQAVTVLLPPAPVVNNAQICAGDPVNLSITGNNEYTWFDLAENTLATGNTFQPTGITKDTTFLVQQAIVPSPQGVGPLNGSFATGGYHNSGFTGTLNFDAEDELTIVSAWLDAGSAGSRTIFLWDGEDGNGNVVDQVTITVPAGPQRVSLNLEVPSAGTYSVGGSSIDLFRNNTGANYPYEIPGLLSITSSSANTDPQGFYYYLYDWEVVGRPCRSEKVPVLVTVSEADFIYTKDNTGTLLSFTNQSTGTNFVWNFGDGSSSTQANPSHGYLSQGTFTVTLTVDGNCIYTENVEIAYNVGIESLAPGLSLSVAPNPTQNRFWLTLNQGLNDPLKVTLYNPNGQQIESREMAPGQTQLAWNTAKLATGVYLVRLQNATGAHTVKVVVQR